MDTKSPDTTFTPSFDHTHNGQNSSQVDQNDILQGPSGFKKQYFAREIDNGSVTTTYNIDWSRGNVQYVTLTGNTTFTFSNGMPGMRAILHVAGAFTPTWPANVRWPTNTVPTPTATSGKKDLYSFIFCQKEKLYDGGVNQNYPIT